MSYGESQLVRLAADLKEVERLLQNMLIARLDWREVLKFVEKQTNILTSLPFQLRARNYMMAQAVSIRAFADTDPTTHSMASFLDSFAKNAKSITRTDLLSFQSTFTGGQLPDWYVPALFLNNSSDRIKPEPILSDLEELQDKVAEVKTFVDKWVAHVDKSRKTYPPPDVSELDPLLDFLDDLYCGYHMKLNGGGLSSAEPKILFPWAWPYSVPWIPAEEWGGALDAIIQKNKMEED